MYDKLTKPQVVILLVIKGCLIAGLAVVLVKIWT